MPKPVQTPDGDWIDDDDYLVLDDDGSIMEILRTFRPAEAGQEHKIQERKILTCEVCGLSNVDDPFAVVYSKLLNRTLCEKHDDEARAAAKQKERDETTSKILENLDGHVTNLLAKSGMRPIELCASVGKIPALIANGLAEHAPELIASLLAGEYPKRGCGLVGVSRIGKSMAFAAMMRESFKAYVLKVAPQVGFDLERKGFIFCSWAHACANWRMDWESSKSSRVKLVQDLSTKPFVFLDDLGREGLSPGRTYNDDPCSLLLNEIVSERHAHGRPLIWTANLAPGDLSKLYGPAMFERIVDLAPPIEIQGAKPITRGAHPVVK